MELYAPAKTPKAVVDRPLRRPGEDDEGSGRHRRHREGRAHRRVPRPRATLTLVERENEVVHAPGPEAEPGPLVTGRDRGAAAVCSCSASSPSRKPPGSASDRSRGPARASFPVVLRRRLLARVRALLVNARRPACRRRAARRAPGMAEIAPPLAALSFYALALEPWDSCRDLRPAAVFFGCWSGSAGSRPRRLPAHRAGDVPRVQDLAQRAAAAGPWGG